MVGRLSFIDKYDMILVCVNISFQYPEIKDKYTFTYLILKLIYLIIANEHTHTNKIWITCEIILIM